MENVNFTVRLKGDVADVVNELVRRGYSASKTEAIRASLVFYGMELGLISPKTMRKRAIGKMRASGRKYSDEEIKRQIKSL